MNALAGPAASAHLFVPVNAPRFNEYVAREGSRLGKFIRSRVRDAAEAEDILQDVLLEFYLATEAIEQAGAWLFRAAKNRIIDRSRKKKEAPLPAAERARPPARRRAHHRARRHHPGPDPRPAGAPSSAGFPQHGPRARSPMISAWSPDVYATTFAVMYAGKIVEKAPDRPGAVLADPKPCPTPEALHERASPGSATQPSGHPVAPSSSGRPPEPARPSRRAAASRPAAPYASRPLPRGGTRRCSRWPRCPDTCTPAGTRSARRNGAPLPETRHRLARHHRCPDAGCSRGQLMAGSGKAHLRGTEALPAQRRRPARRIPRRVVQRPEGERRSPASRSISSPVKTLGHGRRIRLRQEHHSVGR